MKNNLAVAALLGFATAAKTSPEEAAKQPEVSTLQPLNCFYLELS